MGTHIAKHHIAALEAVFGVKARIIGSGGLEQAHEHCALLHREIFRLHVEIGLCRSVDAESVASEIHRVGIHFKNLLLVIEHLDFCGQNPLLALHYQDFHTGYIAQQAGGILRAHTKHVFHKLLRDG